MSKSAFSDAHKILVEQLTAARKQSGMKQEELAALIGKDQSYISNIERGQRRVDVIEFVALVRAMNANPTELFGSIMDKLTDEIAI
jgi:transcriptional regulator with XRE-family HTH domain